VCIDGGGSDARSDGVVYACPSCCITIRRYHWQYFHISQVRVGKALLSSILPTVLLPRWYIPAGNNYYRATLCIARTMLSKDVRPSIFLSHAGILSKWLNISSN